MGRNHLEIKQLFRMKYEAYVEDYKRYLKLRGFGNHHDDWFFVKRGFLECWLTPGFHRFWQTWNPGISYFTYRLYVRMIGVGLGSRRRQNAAILLTFLINGLIHNFVVMVFTWRTSIPLPFTFFALGLFTIFSKQLDSLLCFERWPKIIHLGINAGLIILAFDFGFKMDDLVHSIFIP
jgi:hypothetical protein